MKVYYIFLILILSTLQIYSLTEQFSSGDQDNINKALAEIYQQASQRIIRSDTGDLDIVLRETRNYTAQYKKEILSLDPKKHPRVLSLLNFLPPEKDVFDYVFNLYQNEQTDLSRVAATAVISLNRFNVVTENIAVDAVKRVDDYPTFRAGAILVERWRIRKAIPLLKQAALHENSEISDLAKETISSFEHGKEISDTANVESLKKVVVEPPKLAPVQPETPKPLQPQSMPTPTIAETPETELSSFPWLWIIGATLLLAFAGGILLKLRRK